MSNCLIYRFIFIAVFIKKDVEKQFLCRLIGV